MQNNKVMKQIRTRYEVAAIQQSRIILRIDLPDSPGSYQLIAEMETGKNIPVRSYRDIQLVKELK